MLPITNPHHYRLLHKLRKIPLSVPLDATLVQASINAERHILGNQLPEALDVLAVQGLDAAESGLHDVAAETEEVLGDLGDAGVGVVETGDEDGVFAVGVEFLVDGTLGEDGHLVLRDGVLNRTDAVLHDEVGDQSALDYDVQLGSSVMNVGSVHATRTQEANSHASAITDQSGKGTGVGGDGEAAIATGFRGLDGRAAVEVEEVVTGLVEELSPVDLRGSGDELCDQVAVAGAGVDGDDGREERVDGGVVVGGLVLGGVVVVVMGVVTAAEVGGCREGGSSEEEEEGGSGGKVHFDGLCVGEDASNV